MEDILDILVPIFMSVVFGLIVGGAKKKSAADKARRDFSVPRMPAASGAAVRQKGTGARPGSAAGRTPAGKTVAAGAGASAAVEGVKAVSAPAGRRHAHEVGTETPDVTAKEKIDASKLILYSEIMKPKFDEGLD